MRALVDWERRLRRHYNVDPVDPETWTRARLYNLWFDHAALRMFWTNELEIAPGVFRSNQPTPARLRRLKARGIRAILTLRGSQPTAHYLTEAAWCADLDLPLHSVGLSDREAPSRDTLLHLLSMFHSIERPFLMHCKSGADRAGLASVIYLLAIEKRPLAEARRMLSPRFLHFKASRTGAMDRVIDAYAAEAAGGDFETWVRDRYDPDSLR